MSTQATYTIKETSQLSGLPESTLRYYETIGIINPIGRGSSSKHRVYTQADVDSIDAVACLSATGMSIEDMRTYLANRNKGSEGVDIEIALLETQATRLNSEADYLALRRQYVNIKVKYWQAIKAGKSREAQAIAEAARTLASDLKFPK
jgi:DNA-binding transcriptional MerR regulator